MKRLILAATIASVLAPAAMAGGRYYPHPYGWNHSWRAHNGYWYRPGGCPGCWIGTGIALGALGLALAAPYAYAPPYPYPAPPPVAACPPVWQPGGYGPWGWQSGFWRPGVLTAYGCS